ncbi:MAG: hypothetical protein HYR70_02095 [Chloroflexi bacterium]|nr:hypothetical protein [Chloroflexota bacterium]MBI3341018.1 hypothetical protein [Chloroflexota bacterium]
MNAKDINQTYNLLALAENDTHLKHFGIYYIGPCPFCGGRDRFNLKQTPDGWRWLCRKCTQANYKSPIDYIMRRDDLDFRQALRTLNGKTSQPAPRAQVTITAAPARSLPDSNWESSAWKEVSAANNALLKSQEARDYLTGRRLDQCTWNLYLLGYAVIYDPTVKRQRPAIVIPWQDGETITAIKYRFIDNVPDGLRYTAHKGSTPILFGLSAAANDKTLLLVEGEINCMSISQTACYELISGLDVISFGSDTGGRASILQTIASGYQRVIVWADDAEKSSAIRSMLARPALALCSPLLDNIKHDANILLQKGLLGDFLRETIKDSNTV